VKPRKYEKSCIRLCATKRLVTEASMSFPPGTRFVGSHLLFCQTSVNLGEYVRSGDTGACAPPGVSGEAHASRVRALLPAVVSVGRPVRKSTSHGPREARLRRLPGGVAHPGTRSPW
jgi:hypothetical protein